MIYLNTMHIYSYKNDLILKIFVRDINVVNINKNGKSQPDTACPIAHEMPTEHS